MASNFVSTTFSKMSEEHGEEKRSYETVPGKQFLAGDINMMSLKIVARMNQDHIDTKLNHIGTRC